MSLINNGIKLVVQFVCLLACMSCVRSVNKVKEAKGWGLVLVTDQDKGTWHYLALIFDSAFNNFRMEGVCLPNSIENQCMREILFGNMTL